MHHENIHKLLEELAEYACAHKDDLDPASMGAVTDMLKDVACAQKDAYEAEYYRSVTEAMDQYGQDQRMGYRRGRDSRGRYTSRMGYDDPNDDPTPDGQRINHRKVDDRPGYSGPYMREPMVFQREREYDPDYDDRYGRSFNEFRKAKRHYTDTHSEKDKQRMRESTNEHMTEMESSIREMYEESDPELRKRIKSELTKLAQELA